MISKDIKNIWEDNILNYSAAVNQSRAIPDARTGLKPIHRKILYEMYADKILSNKKFKKCAYMVGQIIARFSEHGDAATYEALVRLAQPWIQRYPLLDFHGNYGSPFGDPSAAMRYTEAKLSPLAEEGILATLKKNTVDWIPNFTYEEDEPSTLPAVFPGLFCLPNQGIGYAIASNFLTFNLAEVADLIINYIHTGELKIIYYDLGSGGTFINPDIMKQIYNTGKGSVIIDAKYEIDNDKIIYTELPFNVMLDDLLEEIAKVCDAEEVKGVKRVYNDSGNNKMRLVVETEKTASVANVIDQLYRKTRLRNSYGINQVALINNKPKLLTQKDMVEIYINHNLNCIVREAKFEYEKIVARIEILEGLTKALEDIENIIQLIKKSSSAANAKTDLINKYQFTENQAKAILDMKLSRLANLEKVEVFNELQEKIEKGNEYKVLIIDENRQKELLIARLTALVKKFDNGRKTEVKYKNITLSKEEKEIAHIEPEKCVVILTEAGSIKRIPATAFKTQRRNGKGVKTQEDITSMILRTNTIDSLMVFTNKGMMYRLIVDEIPEGTNTSKGVSLKSLIEMQPDEKPEVIYSIYRDTNAKYVVFTTKKGLVKKTPLDEYIKTKKKNGVLAINLREGDSLVSVSLINEEPLVLYTKEGMGIKFMASEAPIGSRVTQGVKGITLNEGDELLGMTPIRDMNDMLAIFTTTGMGKKVALSELPLQKRAGKGVKISKDIATVVPVSDEDMILICGDKASICIKGSELPKTTRAATGNIIIKNSNIKTVSKV